MTEPGKGLRFDIYERIHLAEDSIGISELHEAELIPHIQVIKQNEQAVLRGNLLLTGQYIGEDANDKRTLEHLIPVEITLPLSRIHKIEDILVEIENFDVELISVRNLNVTGVLSLHGIELAADAGLTAHTSAKADDAASPEPNLAYGAGTNVTLNEPWHSGEEITFTHQQPVAARTELEQAYISQLPNQEVVQAEPQPELPITAFLSPSYETPSSPYGTDAHTPFNQFEQPQIPSHYEESQRYDPPQETAYQPPSYTEEPLSTSYFAESDYYIEPDAQPQPHPPQEELKEPRIALGSKRSEEMASPEQSYGIKSLLRTAAAAEQTVSADDAQLNEISRLDALEWRKLFLREGSDQQEFRKVKMVIVQKEDSLDEIARRYGVQQRDLQHYNRLNTEDVQTGQILYIPRS